jgi:hypothetical protein
MFHGVLTSIISSIMSFRALESSRLFLISLYEKRSPETIVETPYKTAFFGWRA